MSEQFDPYLKWLGIREADRPPNNYQLLGLELFESDAEVISNAADRQMAHVRTFQAGRYSAISQQVLNELAAARVCLLNAEKKRAYDAEIQARFDRQTAPPIAAAASPAPPAVSGRSAVPPLPPQTDRFVPLSGAAVAEASDEPDALPSSLAVGAPSRRIRLRRRTSSVPLTIGLLVLLAMLVVLAMVIYFEATAEGRQPSSSAALSAAPAAAAMASISG